MHLTLERAPHDTLVVRLREGAETAVVAVRPARSGVASLSRAVLEALADGYGECFWPGAEGGQYWWIFKRASASLEVIAMWTRGGPGIWEHVFRATDSATWLQDHLAAEASRLGLGGDR